MEGGSRVGRGGGAPPEPSKLKDASWGQLKDHLLADVEEPLVKQIDFVWCPSTRTPLFSTGLDAGDLQALGPTLPGT